MLLPSIALTIGSSLYDTQCSSIRLRRTCLPAVDRLEVMFPRNVDFSGALDDTCSLAIDGGEGSETVFSGKITNIEHSPGGLILTMHNDGFTLSRYRPYCSLEGVTTGDVIAALCSDVNVPSDVSISPLSLALYAGEGRQTAAREIARLAALSGGRVSFSGDGTCTVWDPQSGTGQMALLYGREITDMKTGSISPDPTTIEITGEGAGAPSTSKGRMVATNFSGSASPPSAGTVRIAEPLARTTSDASSVAAAFTNRHTMRLSPVRFRTWLVPALAPGIIVELQEMPEYCPLDECFITQVILSISATGGAWCDVWGHGSASGSPSLGGLIR
jgi:hypothetical protein